MITLLILSLTLLALNKVSDASSPIVTIKQGQLEGKKDVSTNGKDFFSFMGIPYAKPPLGTLRFMEPEPPERWDGVKDASGHPSECAHLDLLKVMTIWEPGYVGEEDCLILNLHTPRIDGESNLPVMVYFHGGAFVFGGHEFYEPHELLNENVVIVVVQYRLGALGFLSSEDGVIVGNQGLRDQTIALKWVKQNIEKFSGDKDKVTIFGLSAGGASVHAHLLSRYSKGLFSRAILQSGTLLCPWARMVKPKQVAMTLGDHFGCFKGKSNLEGKKKSQQLLKCLQNVGAKELQLATFQLFKWSFLPGNTVPYVDGDYFADEFETLVKEGKQQNVDVIYGTTRNEGAFVSCPMLVLEEQRKSIMDNFSTMGPISLGFENEKKSEEISKAAFDFYVGGIKNAVEDDDNINNMLGDRHFTVCSDFTAQFHAKQNQKAGKKTFLYELHHRGLNSISNIWGDPPPTENWVAHADDLFYLWPMRPMGPIKRNKDDIRMRDLYTKMFVNFADKGDPTPDDSLGFRWEPFTPESPKHLKLLPKPFMENDSRKKERDFWKSLPTKQNELLFGDQRNAKDEF